MTHGARALRLLVIAGARLADLSPELGAYFGVERGVLVVEVAPETPAADARLKGGDVIVQIGEQPVANVEELRLALAGSLSPRSTFRTLTIVRGGRRTQLAFHD